MRLAALTTTSVAAICLLTLACGKPQGPILIGLAGNIADATGTPMRLAAELAVEQINAAGGVNGREIRLLERNDWANPDSAVTVATELRDSGVVAVIGHLYSGPTLAAAPIYNSGADPVVQISPSSSSPLVSGVGRYTFRICPSDREHGVALATWVREKLLLGRGAILYLNDDYGRGVRTSFSDRFTGLGGTLTVAYPYLSDTTVLVPYLERLARDQQLQFLVVAGYSEDGLAAIRQARERGFRIPIMGGDGLEGVQTAGEVAEGTVQTAAYLPTLDTPTNKAFLKAFRKRFPNAGDPNQAAAGAYDAIYMLRDVFDRVGTKRKAVRDGLNAIGRTAPAFEGVAGKIAFDSLGDVPNRKVYIGVVHGGRVVPVTDQ